MAKLSGLLERFYGMPDIRIGGMLSGMEVILIKVLQVKAFGKS